MPTSQVSGVAGILPANDSGAGQINPTYMQIAQISQAMEQSEKRQAMDTLMKIPEMMKMGIPPKPAEVTKLMKKAGLPAMSPEEYIKSLQGAPAAQPGQPLPNVQPNAVSAVGGAMQGNKAGAAAATPPSKSAGAKAPGGGVTPSALGGGSGVLPKMVEQAQGAAAVTPITPSSGDPTIGQQVGQAAAPPSTGDPVQDAISQGMSEFRTNAVVKARQAADQIDMYNTVAEIRSGKATPEKIGRFLASIGQPLNIEQGKWMFASQEEKQQIINLAAGHESDAQKNMRKDNIRSSLFASPFANRIKDPADFERITSSLAAGQPFPADIKLTRDFTEDVRYADFLAKNVALVGDLKTAKAMTAAQMAGANPLDAIPTGAKSVVTQQLELQQRQVGLQEKELGISMARYGIDLERYKIEMAQMEIAGKKLDAEMALKKNAEFREEFDMFMKGKKLGVNYPGEYQTRMVNEAASRAGLSVKEKSGLSYFISVVTPWVSSYEYTPRSLGEGQMKQVTGTPTEAPPNATPGKPGKAPSPRVKSPLEQLNEKKAKREDEEQRRRAGLPTAAESISTIGSFTRGKLEK